MQNRRTLAGEKELAGAMYDGSQALVLDVLFSSSDGSQLCIIHGEENWPDSGWVPIGIVVVPGSHNRYGDNSCGVMSLVPMSLYGPETGQPVASNTRSDSESDAFNFSAGNFSGYTLANIFKSETGVAEYNNRYGYIPYEASSTSTTWTTSDNNYCLWPYETLAVTTNPSTAYSNSGTYPYVTSISGKAGCDFNGIRNTLCIYLDSYSLNGSSWYITPIVDNNDSSYLTPAAASAGRFKTTGTNSFIDVFGSVTSYNSKYGMPTSTKTNKGFWYLPALGELCYLPAYKLDINSTITALNSKYSKVGSKLLNNSYYGYWSSTYCYTLGVWAMYPGDGHMEGRPLNFDSLMQCVTRAFLRF